MDSKGRLQFPRRLFVVIEESLGTFVEPIEENLTNRRHIVVEDILDLNKGILIVVVVMNILIVIVMDIPVIVVMDILVVVENILVAAFDLT